MAQVNPSLPTLGSARGDGETAVRADLVALLGEFNGNIDNANIKAAAAIAGSKLAAGGVGSAQLATGAVGIPQLALGAATRLLGFLNQDSPGTWGNGVSRFLHTTAGLVVTHTRTTATVVLIWGWRNTGGVSTTMTPTVYVDGTGQGTMNFITTLPAGASVVHAAAQTITVTAGGHQWNAGALQGANATTVAAEGPGVLLVLES